MTNEEIAMKIAEHENRIKVSEHRIQDLEEQQKYIQELTLSVQELAISVKNMSEEQKAQGEKIRVIEDEPRATWKAAKTTAVTTIVGIIFGALTTGVMLIIANNL